MSKATEAPKRLRAADVIDGYRETIEQLTARTPRVPTVKASVSRNAKGDPQFSIEIDAQADADLGALRVFASSVRQIALMEYDNMDKYLPHAEANGGGQ